MAAENLAIIATTVTNKVGANQRLNVIPLPNSLSDSHLTTPLSIVPRNFRLRCLFQLGERWKQDHGAVQGEQYILRELPRGYSCYLSRAPGVNHIYFTGHPSGKEFEGIISFWQHFEYMMGHADTSECTCQLCPPHNAMLKQQLARETALEELHQKLRATARK